MSGNKNALRSSQLDYYVEDDNGCWVYSGFTDRRGYGRIGGKMAHRAAWERANGPIPEGMFVCHHCDRPPCINPAHLFVGTPQDNVDDKVRKGRQSRLIGERNANVKLTAAEVRDIRLRYSAGGVYMKDLAALFGVSQGHVSDIVNFRKWNRGEGISA